MPRKFVILPCAGSGTRMGGQTPKFLLELGGISVLGLTLLHLEQSSAVDEVVLVVPEAAFESLLHKELTDLPHRKISWVVTGGSERQHSIFHGLMAIHGDNGAFRKKTLEAGLTPQIARPDDLVAVHDAVRPFASPELFTRIFSGAAQTGAAIAAIPAQDTIKKGAGGVIAMTVDRRDLFQAQTPQAFRFDWLFEAYQAARNRDFLGTDDASLVEALGKPVSLLPGEKANLKVTTPEDLVVARALWEEEKRKSS